MHKLKGVAKPLEQNNMGTFILFSMMLLVNRMVLLVE